MILSQVTDVPDELDQRLYDALVAAQQQYEAAGWREAEDWSASHDRGLFVLRFPDKVIAARAQVIGTFNGWTFKWSWDNPTIPEPLTQDARQLCRLCQQQGWTALCSMFPARAIDGTALAALAASLSGASGCYTGQVGSTSIYYVLHDLRPATTPEAEPPDEEYREQGLSGLEHLLAQQFAQGQLPLPTIRAVELVCRDAWQQIEAGNWRAAIVALERAWAMLGDFNPCEQPPSGWIRLALADAQFRVDDFAGALDTLQHKGEDCPDLPLFHTRRAQCHLRLQQHDAALDAFAFAFVAGGTAVFNLLPEQDAALFRAELQRREQLADARVAAATVANDDEVLARAAATVRCLIADWFAWETGAIRRGTRRGADWIAQQWVWLAATWLTTPRSVSWGSYGSTDHDPDREHVTSTRWSDDRSRLLIDTRCINGDGIEHQWRYEVVAEEDERPRVSRLWAVYDDEEIECSDGNPYYSSIA
ncbi:MAG: tetratricopeptide repeat protein [Planctomycetota bacterium]